MPPKNPKENVSDSDSSDGDAVDRECIYCKKEKIKFMAGSCRHPAACKKCAMKLATGGKCRQCGNMFAGWKAIT